MQISAAVTESKGAPFELQLLELEDPRPDEILVRLVGSGICHTDLIVRDQWYPVPLPAVLGHEGSGVVEAVGADVVGVRPGDHVVMSFNSCGSCPSCVTARPFHCHTFLAHNFAGTRLDGTSPIRRGEQPVHGVFFGQSAFATHAIANQRNVVVVDSDVPLELLGPLGCGIQTGAGGVLNSLAPAAGSSIVVFGAGSVGLSAVMAAVVAECSTIVAVDLHPDRLALAQKLGATHTVQAGLDTSADALREAVGIGAEYSLETTGVPAVLREAVAALAPGGVCGLIGAAAPGTDVALDMADLLFKTVRGIVEGDSVPGEFIPELVRLFKAGQFPIDQLITTYDFADIERAVADSESGTTVKPVLTYGARSTTR